MEHTTQTAPNPSEQEKQAIFARVWKRVMAGQEAACPWPGPTLSHRQRRPLTRPLRPPIPGRGQGSPPSRWPALPPSPEETFPRRRRRGVLGPGCLECAPLLQSLIRRELADGREYQTLARRASGAPARVLAALAGRRSAGPGRSRRPTSSSPGCATGRRPPPALPCPRT